MSAINRQKFMAELAKLLTFMYEEDRLYALSMYERMFDIAEGDEQWLIQNLMSPTRQAVIIARSYDAKERKLSVSAQWKEEDGYEEENDETPPFVLAINRIFDDLFPEEPEEAEGESDDQLSFADLGVEETTVSRKPKMPRGAVMLNRTQEFQAVTETDGELLPGEGQEDYWSGDFYDDFLDYDPEEDPNAASDVVIEMIDRADYETETGADEPAQSHRATPAAEVAAGTTSAGEAPEKPDAEAEKTENPAEVSESGAKETAVKETAVETQLRDTPQAQPREKKRRSIEDLLGFRKEPKKEENTEPGDLTEESSPDTSESTASVSAEKIQTGAPAVPEKTDKAEPESATNDKPVAVPAEQGAAGQNDTAPEVKSKEQSPSDTAVPEPVKAPAENLFTEQAAPESVKESGDRAEPAEQKPERSEPENSKPEESRSGVDQSDSGKRNDALLNLPKENEPVIRKPEPVRKEGMTEQKKELSLPILVLFLILAIPLTLLALALLAIPTVLCFGLSIGLIALGTVLVFSAFSGFAVLADIMLLLGAAVIAMGLGLLFLWISFWMIGDVMAGLVRWVKELAENWCYKEVPAA